MTPDWDELEDRAVRDGWNIVARVKPGLTVQQAEAGITSTLEILSGESSSRASPLKVLNAFASNLYRGVI